VRDCSLGELECEALVSFRNLVQGGEDHGRGNFRGAELERRRLEWDMGWRDFDSSRILRVASGGSS